MARNAHNPLGPGESAHAFKVWLTETRTEWLRCRGWGHEFDFEHNPDVAIGRLYVGGPIVIICPCAHGCGVTANEHIGDGTGKTYAYPDGYLITDETGIGIITMERREIIKIEFLARIKKGERLPIMQNEAAWRTLFR